MGSGQTTKQKISISQLIQKYSGQLPPAELDQLMSLAVKKPLEYIYKNPKKPLSVSTARAFKKYLRQRQAGYPLAYIKGYKEFFGLKFLVNKHTLVPRPESELLLEAALEFSKKLSKPNIIDIGTGSGCLILSLAKNTKQPATYWAGDISSKALQTAQTNARKLALKNQINFIKSNLLKNIPQQKFDIVMANLPYLTPLQMKEPSIKKEPKSALLAGQDGLYYYKKLLKQLPDYLNQNFLVLLEIDPQQEGSIQELVKKNFPKAKIEFEKDLSGLVRVVKITAQK